MALASAPEAVKSSIIPLFLMPPSGAYDHEVGRRLTPIEHIRSFGPRLYSAWGRRPVFVDGLLISDERHANSLGAHPLTELLDKAHFNKALACPATALDRSADYQQAVARFVAHHAPLPICIRVKANQLDPDFKAKLSELLHKLSCEPRRALLNLDFEQNVPKSNEVEGFAQLLAEHISDLPFLYDWLGIAVSLTAFPEKTKLKAGQSESYERTDWLTYKRLLAIQGDRSRRPMFSDYAVDPAPYANPVRAAPSAHLRYTSDGNYIIVKGTTTKKPFGYSAIFPVAETLVKRNEFMGDTFSEGDMFIRQLASKSGGTGNAPKWRWASTDHHLNLVANGLDALLGTKSGVKDKVEVFGFQETLL